MKRLALLAFAAAALGLLTACGGSEAPSWLKSDSGHLLNAYFEGVKPTTAHYRVGRDRAAAGFSFGKTVPCHACSCPANVKSCPAGDGVTFLFSRKTHRLLGMTLCDGFSSCPATLSVFRRG